jgi:hypothetical protein
MDIVTILPILLLAHISISVQQITPDVFCILVELHITKYQGMINNRCTILGVQGHQHCYIYLEITVRGWKLGYFQV